MKVQIRKSLSRTINTAQYENVIIKCEIEVLDEIIDNDQLLNFQKEITNKLINDYKNTEKQVLNELNLSEKSAFIKQSHIQETEDRKISLTPEEESEIFG